MNRKLGKVGALFAGMTALAVSIGCGGNGASNNDQGISVTFLGFFQGLATGCTTLPTGLSGLLFRLGEAGPEPATGSTTPAGEISSSSIAAVVGIQNNLFREYFRADRMILHYFIPGATVQPPDTNVPVSLFAGNALPGGSTTGGGNSISNAPGRIPVSGALPITNNNTCNRVFAQVVILPAPIREWLNFNRDSLPETPFNLEVTAELSGQTSAGDRLTTNPATLYVEVVEETFVTPTEGTDTSTGAVTDGTSTDALTGGESTTPTDTGSEASDTGSDSTSDTTSDGSGSSDTTGDL